MRTVLAALAAALVLGLAIQGPGRAAIETVRTTHPPMELVVFEHPDCTYCQHFRGRVVPRYRQSQHEAEAPLRFVDITATDTSRMHLKAPISMVPTAVVLKHGREVDRIIGLWGADNFFKMVTTIIDSTH